MSSDKETVVGVSPEAADRTQKAVESSQDQLEQVQKAFSTEKEKETRQERPGQDDHQYGRPRPKESFREYHDKNIGSERKQEEQAENANDEDAVDDLNEAADPEAGQSNDEEHDNEVRMHYHL